MNEQCSLKSEGPDSTWISWNILYLAATSLCFGGFFFLLCRNLLELTNFNNLETEACPTWRGKLIGMLSACCPHAVVECFHACAPELWAKHSYCPLLLWELKHMFNGKRLRNTYSRSFHSLTFISQLDVSLKEKKKLRINAIKDNSGWKVWKAEVKVCVNRCGSCFLWPQR